MTSSEEEGFTPQWTEEQRHVLAVTEEMTALALKDSVKRPWRETKMEIAKWMEEGVRLVDLSHAIKAEQAMANMSGPETLSYCVEAGMWTQADLARASGLTPATLGAFKKGKRPTAAQRAALCWALTKRC